MRRIYRTSLNHYLHIKKKKHIIEGLEQKDPREAAIEESGK
jgi:hypothetical protein